MGVSGTYRICYPFDSVRKKLDSVAIFKKVCVQSAVLHIGLHHNVLQIVHPYSRNEINKNP